MVGEKFSNDAEQPNDAYEAWADLAEDGTGEAPAETQAGEAEEGAGGASTEIKTGETGGGYPEIDEAKYAEKMREMPNENRFALANIRDRVFALGEKLW